MLEWQWEPAEGAAIIVRKDGTGHFERLEEAVAAMVGGERDILIGPGDHAISETLFLTGSMSVCGESGNPADTSIYVSQPGLTNTEKAGPGYEKN